MRVRESALFAGYASVIVYGVIALPSLVMHYSSGPRMEFLMIPLTFLPVLATAALYMRKRPLDRPSRGAALGALSAISIYCAVVLGMAGVFFLFATFHNSNSQPPAQFALGLVWYGLLSSPLLLPGPMLVSAFAGMFYIWAKRRLGLGNAMEAKQSMSRSQRMVFVIALIAAPVLFLPAFTIVGGLPALALVGRLFRG